MPFLLFVFFAVFFHCCLKLRRPKYYSLVIRLIRIRKSRMRLLFSSFIEFVLLWLEPFQTAQVREQLNADSVSIVYAQILCVCVFRKYVSYIAQTELFTCICVVLIVHRQWINVNTITTSCTRELDLISADPLSLFTWMNDGVHPLNTDDAAHGTLSYLLYIWPPYPFVHAIL